MNSIALSVVIPTRNRSSYLRDTLERFSLCLKTLSSEQGQKVEIVVSDNWSSDETLQVAKQYIRNDPRFRYAKHKTPELTAEESMASAITAARGKYVWIFGDDDIPSANSLRTAFDTLRPDVSFYLYNMALLLPNGSSKIYLTRNDVDEYYNSGSTLWQSVGFVTATTTLSSLCFQRDLFAQETFNEFKLLSQIYSHSVGMFVMFHDKPCSVVLSPMYTYRQNTHDEEKERMSAHCVSQRVPSEYPFSVGLFKLLRRAARKTGEKMHNLLSAKEVEIRKDTWERANTCTHDFIGRFLKARYDHVRSSGISALRPSDVSMLWCRLCLAIARGSMPPGNSTHARFRCD